MRALCKWYSAGLQIPFSYIGLYILPYLYSHLLYLFHWPFYKCKSVHHADIPRAIMSVDNSAGVMQALFAPFPQTTFPRTLDTTALTRLLTAPLACRVPLSPSAHAHNSRLFPDLFCSDPTMSAYDLDYCLLSALKLPWPTGSATELLLTSFWDGVGYKLPEIAAGHLGIAVSENRSVDISLCCLLQLKPQMLCGLPHTLLGWL